VVRKIAAFLIANNIPHNLMLTNLGRKVYIFPRKVQQSGVVRAGWLEACGVGVMWG
jgi:hypothetical protein